MSPELPETEWVSTVVIGIYCAVFATNNVLCCIAGYFQNQQGKQFGDNSLIILAWCSMISYNLCVLLQLIGVFFWYTNSLANAFYGTGNLFIYLLLIFRVKLTFRGTVYQLKSYLYKISYILAIINWMIYIAASVFQFLYSLNPEQIGESIFGISYFIQSLVGILFDLLLCVSFGWIFIHKLLQSTTQIITDNFVNPNNSNFSLNFSQKRQINVIVKSFILSCIAILSAQITTLLWLIYDTIYQLYGYDYEHFQSNNVYYSFIIIYTVDTTVNTLCILLQFKFMEQVYLVICTRCHECVYGYCNKYAKRKVADEMERHFSEKSHLHTRRFGVYDEREMYS